MRERGFSAPAIFAADRDAGLLVIEDLGDDLVVAGDPPAPVEPRYEVAVDLLAALHGMTLPDVLPVEPGVDYALPRYDMEALLIEAELLLDWYLPMLDAKVSDAKREAYLALWREALNPAIEAPATWVLRDVHSPNLLWLPEREGMARVGLLDFQDALLGPARLRSRLAVAGRARRRAGDDGDRAALALYPRAPRGRCHVRRGRLSRKFMPRSPPSAPPRSSAFSPASTRATASRNIYVTCRVYGPICSARWRIRRWRRLSAWYSVNVPALNA